MTDIIRNISGYFYTDMYEYLYLVTDDSAKNYKFIFKEGKIYADDGVTQINANDFIAVIKKVTSEFRNKILEHSAQLESYEKIYTNHRYFSKFIKKHPVLKYEIHKFQNKISHFYEALAICQNEQPSLKKLLQNYTYEANIFKNVVSENTVKAEEIFNYIQNIRSEKINRNIYILTLLSLLFLPLNFITSFFGMNTNGMFLEQMENGTFVLSVAMFAIVILLVFVFWLKSKKE